MKTLKTHQFFFIASLLVSILLIISTNNSYIFYAKYAIKPFEIFVHEASHGIAALMSGFEIVEFEMRWLRGHVSSLQPETAYLRSAFVSFSGYAGGTIFGFMIFLASIKYRKVFMGILTLMSIYFTFHFSDLHTVGIMAYIIAVFALCTKEWKGIDYILRFIGVYIMTTSVIAPTHQLAHDRHSDSISLQELIPLPEWFYVGLWMLFSISTIFYSFKLVRVIDKNIAIEDTVHSKQQQK